MAFRVMARGIGETEFVKNGLIFETEKEATRYKSDLWSRWFGCEELKVAETDEPVNYVWDFELNTIRSLE